MNTSQCLQCQKEFEGRKDKKFCSTLCRVTFSRKSVESTDISLVTEPKKDLKEEDFVFSPDIPRTRSDVRVKGTDGFYHICAWDGEFFSTVSGNFCKLCTTKELRLAMAKEHFETTGRRFIPSWYFYNDKEKIPKEIYEDDFIDTPKELELLVKVLKKEGKSEEEIQFVLHAQTDFKNTHGDYWIPNRITHHAGTKQEILEKVNKALGGNGTVYLGTDAMYEGQREGVQ